MQVPSLDQEEPLEEGMATHSSILAWEIPWTEEPGGLWSTKSQRLGHKWRGSAHMERFTWKAAAVAAIHLLTRVQLFRDPMDCRKGGHPDPGIEPGSPAL